MGINKNAVIVLHEIYGINSFIKDICENLKTLRFDVFCPDMLEGKRFPYSKAEEAHSCFYSNIKPDYYKEVEALISMLKAPMTRYSFSASAQGRRLHGGAANTPTATESSAATAHG